MDQNTTDTLNQNVDMLFSNLENFTQNEGVIGKPVVHEDKTFLPVVSVTLGYGGGNSASKAQPGDTGASGGTLGSMAGKMSGGALGLGAKLFTEAVIVIDKTKDNVTLLPINAAAGSQLADKIPQIISGMNMKQGGQSNQQGGSQGQGNTQGQGGSQGQGTTM